MIRSSIAQLAEPIGFDIAQSDDCVQSDLLNGLGRGLNTYTNKQDFERQICYLSQKLTKDAKHLILELSEMIKEIDKD